MSNVVYPSARVGWLNGTMCWTRGTHRAQLWRGAAYAPLHTYVQDVIDGGGSLVAQSAPLATSVTANGACDADDAIFDSIAKGPVLTVMTIAQTSGPTGGTELPANQQRLVCFINRAADNTLPFPPTGNPVTVKWSDLTSRIFIP